MIYEFKEELYSIRCNNKLTKLSMKLFYHQLPCILQFSLGEFRIFEKFFNWNCIIASFFLFKCNKRKKPIRQIVNLLNSDILWYLFNSPFIFFRCFYYHKYVPIWKKKYKGDRFNIFISQFWMNFLRNNIYEYWKLTTLVGPLIIYD